jgi:hypothetical protein
MAKGRRCDPRIEARWRQVLHRQADSGLSVRAYCFRERLTEASFYAWRMRIRQRDARRQPAGPAFLPVVVQPASPPHADGAIAIQLRGGRVLRLPLSIPPAQLAVIRLPTGVHAGRTACGLLRPARRSIVSFRQT